MGTATSAWADAAPEAREEACRSGGQDAAQDPCPSGDGIKLGLMQQGKGSLTLSHFLRKGNYCLAPKNLVSHLHHQFATFPQSLAEGEGCGKVTAQPPPRA